jgi:hypothetical protein
MSPKMVSSVGLVDSNRLESTGNGSFNGKKIINDQTYLVDFLVDDFVVVDELVRTFLVDFLVV